jgi:hypothetical protein
MWFYVGLLVGGLLSAALLMTVGSIVRAPLPTEVRMAVVALVAVAVALRDLTPLPVWLPQNARQVPQSIGVLGRQGALQFGVEMGTGMRTFMTSGVPHLAAAALILFAGPAAAVASGLGFGLGRVLMAESRRAHPAPDGWDDSISAHSWLLRFVSLVGVLALLPALLGI